MGIAPGNVTAPVPWRVYPGGHLRRIAIASRGISSLFGTPTGELWAAIGMGLLVYRDGGWQRSAVPAEIHDSYFGPFAWYRNHLYAGAQRLLRYDRGSWQIVEQLLCESINCLTVDAAGFLWVGTTFNGVWRSSDGQTWESVALPSRGTCILAICSDAAGTVWAAERGHRPAIRPIYAWRDEAWEMLPLPSKPRAFNYIWALTADAEGRLWAGSANNGVFRWANGTWTHFAGTSLADRKPGLPGSSVNALCADAQGRVWAATHNGIGVYAEDVWRLVVVAPEQGITEQGMRLWVADRHSPHCLHLDSQGRLLIGTSDGQVGWIDTTQGPYPFPLPMITGYY